MLWYRPEPYEKLYRKRNRRRKDFVTKHHLTPQERYKFGEKTWWSKDGDENILRLRRSRHDIWHRLFKNLTLEEAAAVLMRLSKMKGRTA